MLGREILSCGFSVSMLKSGFDLCELTSPIDFCDNDSDVSHDMKDILVSLLRNFSGAFIAGLPCTRVTTGELRIQLQDQNFPVHRRSYRLSPDEKQVVKNKTKELM